MYLLSTKIIPHKILVNGEGKFVSGFSFSSISSSSSSSSYHMVIEGQPFPTSSPLVQKHIPKEEKDFPNNFPIKRAQLSGQPRSPQCLGGIRAGRAQHEHVCHPAGPFQTRPGAPPVSPLGVVSGFVTSFCLKPLGNGPVLLLFLGRNCLLLKVYEKTGEQGSAARATWRRETACPSPRWSSCRTS